MQLWPLRYAGRSTFFCGAIAAFIAGIYLAWLWQKDRQVRLHSSQLIRQLEKRNWSAAQGLIAPDYGDDWGNDREQLLARIREVFRYARAIQIVPSNVQTRASGRDGFWKAKIRIVGEGEAIALIKERINTLAAPFELSWHRQSAKPWDWQLVRASNRELLIRPEEY